MNIDYRDLQGLFKMLYEQQLLINNQQAEIAKLHSDNTVDEKAIVEED